jgi:hypothetical protein
MAIGKGIQCKLWGTAKPEVNILFDLLVGAVGPAASEHLPPACSRDMKKRVWKR